MGPLGALPSSPLPSGGFAPFKKFFAPENHSLTSRRCRLAVGQSYIGAAGVRVAQHRHLPDAPFRPALCPRPESPLEGKFHVPVQLSLEVFQFVRDQLSSPTGSSSRRSPVGAGISCRWVAGGALGFGGAETIFTLPINVPLFGLIT